MKRIFPLLATCLLLQFSSAKEPGRLVRVVYVGGHLITGSIVDKRNMNSLLFLDEPCPLAIEGSQKMRRAWMALGAYQVGCWYPTINDTYVTIDGVGHLYPIGAYWEQWPRAILHEDGTATITEPNFDSATFLQALSTRKMNEMLSHVNEKP